MAAFARLLGLTALAAGATALAITSQRRVEQAGGDLHAVNDRPPTQLAARRLDRASALLAASVLADSAVEHYRGSFHNKTMYAPLGVSAVTLVASLRDAVTGGAAPPIRRDGLNGLAVVTGIIGTGFHIYNIAKRPGGFSWLNLFYAAPFGAPAALSLTGLLGSAAHRLRRNDGAISGALLAGLVSAGLFGTGIEAGLLHFRGAYHNPAMVIPVVAAPTTAALLARLAASPRWAPLAARWALRLLTGIGFVGAAFHAYGVQRNMGGWRNWSQNLLNGPPLPAPPSFTALSLAGSRGHWADRGAQS